LYNELVHLQRHGHGLEHHVLLQGERDQSRRHRPAVARSLGQGTLKRATLGFAVLAVAALTACGGGGGNGAHASSSTTRSSSGSAASATTTATAGGLTITFTATPTQAKSGETVQFVVDAREQKAPGLLGYQIDYGDGVSDGNAVAQFCRSPAPAHDTWKLQHAYTSVGAFHPSVTVTANCTPDHATATVAVTVG
jgi:hypothetical protein